MNGFLVSIKKVHEHCFNNCKSTNIGNPYRDHGTFKTHTMITALDNVRRRVWCKSSFDSYVLFVHVGGERLVLAKDQHCPVSFGMIEDLVSE